MVYHKLLKDCHKLCKIPQNHVRVIRRCSIPIDFIIWNVREHVIPLFFIGDNFSFNFYEEMVQFPSNSCFHLYFGYCLSKLKLFP